MPRLPRKAWPPLLLLLLLAGYLLQSPDPVGLRPLAADATLLAFGDSLTYGTGAPAAASYPAQLERLIKRRVINAGVPGELTREGRERLPEWLATHQPDLVILCHGGNDLLRQTGKAQAARNLRAMIQTIRQAGAQVVLLGVPSPGLFLASAPLYTEVAEALEVPLENRILAEILDDKALKSDPIHPNARGYRLMAEAVAELLRQSGALPEV